MEMLRKLTDSLRDIYDAGEARALSLLVLEDAFGVSRTEVYADKVRNFSPQEHARLQNIFRRLRDGEPIQYILGRARFCDASFRVTPATLIPRPETEELVELVTRHLSLVTCHPSLVTERPGILDVGTGSGCIAVTLKRRFPRAAVEAWDVSPEALAVARENARALGAEVRFRQVDVLAEPPACDMLPSPGLLVSNPPYVLRREAADMEPHVLEHEPHRALFVPDDDPLLFYRALARLAVRGRFRGVFLEANRAFADDVAALFRAAGYPRAEVLRDQFGNKRFVVC
ncbi:MAG: peptide chain release factor N(5)-glutamine methyltransferase [Alloprevotella sp.]|nr:peptide chain release factor N(5)-glutamine methyltransferase [Alloprevotella sp.]MBR1651776.1 peptide chain release factor N(5)-glutamine methyltransferase [Alloprevotella sp.]